MLNEKDLEELLGSMGYSLLDEDLKVKSDDEMLEEEILDLMNNWLEKETIKENWLESNMRSKND